MGPNVSLFKQETYLSGFVLFPMIVTYFLLYFLTNSMKFKVDKVDADKWAPNVRFSEPKTYLLDIFNILISLLYFL
jgi:hypothetical protein